MKQIVWNLISLLILLAFLLTNCALFKPDCGPKNPCDCIEYTGCDGSYKNPNCKNSASEPYLEKFKTYRCNNKTGLHELVNETERCIDEISPTDKVYYDRFNAEYPNYIYASRASYLNHLHYDIMKGYLSDQTDRN